MSRFWQNFISNGSPPAFDPPGDPTPTENEALDAYSRVVVTVAEKLRPTRK